MTCKDCFHEKVCNALIKDGLPYLEDSGLPAEAFCLAFDNKLDIIKIDHRKWTSASSKPNTRTDKFLDIISRLKNNQQLMVVLDIIGEGLRDVD
jgi:hypothetical protein